MPRRPNAPGSPKRRHRLPALPTAGCRPRPARTEQDHFPWRLRVNQGRRPWSRSGTPRKGAHMRSFATTGKMVSCVLVPSLLLGACGAPQGPVGVAEQGDATYSYMFNFDTMVIQNTRSRVTDTDFASIAVGVDGREIGSVARYVGDYNNGTYPVNLSFGPFTVGPSSPVSIAYSIYNRGQRGEDFASFVGSISAIAAFATGTYL